MSENAISPPKNPASISHSNNFDALRLLGAFLVIFAHQHELMGVFSPLYMQAEAGSLGVVIFFAISGFLITTSWLADPHIIRFSVRRFLRIWPALAVVVLLSVFILGPLVTTKSTADYFSNILTWQYFHNLRFKVMFFLPGVFETNPHAAVNGPLWTIPLEVKCYIIIAIIGIIGAFRWKYLVLSAFLAFGFYVDHRYQGNWHVFTKNRSLSNEYIFVFLLGCVMSLFKDHWMGKRLVTFAAASAIALVFVYISKPLLGFMVFFAVSTLLIGLQSTKYVRDAAKYGDFSYGLYIYAFPVQQLLVLNFGKDVPFPIALAASTFITLVLAVMSWYFVEKQALRFKPQRPKASKAGSAP